MCIRDSCNIVTLSEEEGIPFPKRRILDHSSGEISTEDCSILLHAVMEEMDKDPYHFYVGTSYRHCLIWENGRVEELTPPHDVLGREIAPYLSLIHICQNIGAKVRNDLTHIGQKPRLIFN